MHISLMGKWILHWGDRMGGGGGGDGTKYGLSNKTVQGQNTSTGLPMELV